LRGLVEVIEQKSNNFRAAAMIHASQFFQLGARLLIQSNHNRLEPIFFQKLFHLCYPLSIISAAIIPIALMIEIAAMKATIAADSIFSVRLFFISISFQRNTYIAIAIAMSTTIFNLFHGQSLPASTTSFAWP